AAAAAGGGRGVGIPRAGPLGRVGGPVAARVSGAIARVGRVDAVGHLEAIGPAIVVGGGVGRVRAEGALAVVGEAVAVGVGEGLEVHDVGLLAGRETGERAAEEPHEVLSAPGGVGPR